VRLLIKIGGTLLDAAESRERLAREIAKVAEREQVVVVHGGGKQMTRFLAERGVESRFVNGLRVTTDEVIDAVVKVFAGSVNAQLVTAFRAAGANPVGLSGLSGKMVDAIQLDPALGHVGKPEASDGRLLEVLVRESYLPVVACVAGNRNGSIFNVNGDQMAAACAHGFGADRLIFLTDVEGVRDVSGRTCGELTAEQGLNLISSGVATGGMQAKIEAAVTALKHGVGQVLIAPGAQSEVIDQLLAGSPIGTSFILG
jgi:acetylglutamate kinase